MRHLQRRNGVFYFRYRLPKRLAALLGRQEFKQSLYTQSYEVALEVIAPKISVLRRIKLMANSENLLILKELFRELTDYSKVDGYSVMEREDERNTLLWEVMEKDARESLRDGGDNFNPKDYGIKTTYPDNIEGKRDYQNLLIELADAMYFRIVNGRCERF